MANGKTKLAVIAGVALASSLVAAAFAATQGTPGATSTGSADVRAEKESAVSITGLNDIVFAASATTPAPLADPVCVFSNPGSYTVNVSSANAAGGTYRLSSGSGFINYSVSWFNAGSGGATVALTSGTASPSITGADQTSPTCGGGDTARIQVTIDPATYISAPAATYTDTLTIIVSPT